MKNLLGAIFLSIAFIFSGCTNAQTIDINSFEKKLDSNVQVLDVRSPQEYSEGYIPGAININVNSADFTERIQSLNQEKPVYIYCRTGNRSRRAAEILKKEGFKEPIVIEGGFTDWKNAGNEVEMPKE